MFLGMLARMACLWTKAFFWLGKYIFFNTGLKSDIICKTPQNFNKNASVFCIMSQWFPLMIQNKHRNITEHTTPLGSSAPKHRHSTAINYKIQNTNQQKHHPNHYHIYTDRSEANTWTRAVHCLHSSISTF